MRTRPRFPSTTAAAGLTILLASSAASLMACSGDDTSAADAGGSDARVTDARAEAGSDAGGDASLDAGTDARADAEDAGDAADASDASDAADTGDPCATDGGDAGFVTYTFDWNFAVSSTALNGGKGQVITVRRCDSVRWHNTEGSTHSVVSAAGGFDTGSILFNETSAPIQMKRVGVFPYVCGIHGSVMSGELTVK